MRTIRSQVSAVFVLGAGLLSTGMGEAGPERRAPRLAAVVNFDCAAQAMLPKGDVASLASGTAGAECRRGGTTWGDRAWKAELGPGSEPDFLVPLTCGATGNCDWAVLVGGPARVVGRLEGDLIYIHAHTSGWARLTTYESTGAGEGIVMTYVYGHDGYELHTKVNVAGRDFDDFARQYGLQPTCELGQRRNLTSG